MVEEKKASGVGASMAGGNPANGRADDDFYVTPSSAIYGLIEALPQPYYHLNQDAQIWEAFCGEGQMMRDLSDQGFSNVAGSDLVNRGAGITKDFFDFTKSDRLGNVIISNPPWDQAEEVIRHAREVCEVDFMALLLKSTYFHAAERLPLWNQHRPVETMPLTWRLDFKGQGRPVMECTWFIWAGKNEAAITETRPIARPARFAPTRKRKKHAD